MKLRFTIRDWLWLALVAALAVAWFVDHKRVVEDASQKLETSYAEAREKIGELLRLQPQAPSAQQPTPAPTGRLSQSPMDRMPILRGVQ